MTGESITLKLNPAYWDNANLLFAISKAIGHEFQKDLQTKIQLEQIAAEQGNEEALLKLGIRYELGDGVEADLKIAWSFYEKATQHQNGEAAYRLAVLYQKLAENVNVRDYCGLVHRAAQFGSSEGQYAYAICLLFGYGTNRNYDEAFDTFYDLYEKEFPGSAYYLGLCFRFGLGIEKSPEAALQILRVGAGRGEGSSFLGLAALYEEGIAVERDLDLALLYTREAADLGEPLAYTNLGTFYANGVRVEADMRIALKFWRKAAKEGERFGIEKLERLGFCKRIGEGLKYRDTETEELYTIKPRWML